MGTWSKQIVLSWNKDFGILTAATVLSSWTKVPLICSVNTFLMKKEKVYLYIFNIHFQIVSFWKLVYTYIYIYIYIDVYYILFTALMLGSA